MAKYTLDELFSVVRQHGRYIERNYDSIGGMWTVDTWKLDGVAAPYYKVRVQLLDEGATNAAHVGELLSCYETYGRGPVFGSGNMRVLESVL